jgi:phosphate/phosphite/phosphonate ABC transporter binding protein
MLERLSPLAQFLSKRLHSPVKIVLTTDFQDYERRLRNGEFDIAFSNPTHYAKTSHTNEIIVMQAKNGRSLLRGLIIVRADSNITYARGLIGHSVAIVSWESTAGYLSQKVFLEAQGIQVTKQLRLQEACQNKQENVILSVYHGDVDAGFINEDALHIVDAYVPPQHIRVIERTSWLPNWALSIKRSLPVMVKARIRQAILGIKSGDPILKAMQVNNLVSATDADYDVLRRTLGLTMPVR